MNPTAILTRMKGQKVISCGPDTLHLTRNQTVADIIYPGAAVAVDGGT